MSGRVLEPKLLFLVTEDWYFCSHRIDLARAARAAGYQITVVTQVGADGARIRQEGFKLIPVKFPRSFAKPWNDAFLLARLVQIYRRERPDIIHHVSMKPVLYGSLAAKLAGTTASVVNALTGLGYVFTGQNFRVRAFRRIICMCLRRCFARTNSTVILQNPDDQSLLIEAGVLSEGKVTIIAGSGVDIDRFPYCPEPIGVPRVVFASRLLWDKGVGEFIAAARLLKALGSDATFVLVGEPDSGNPTSVSQLDIDGWMAEGLVEWWGWRTDMAVVFSQCHIVCLPSYREGLPKVLLEAAACGRALVAADVPGSREVVQHETTGLLAVARDATSLSAALQRLLCEPEMRERLGRAGRALVVARFSLSYVVDRTLDVYGGLVGD